MSPLSKFQKAELAQLARAAYDGWAGRAEFEAANLELSRTKCFEAWRHVETGKATGGVQSLRDCTQNHYGRVKAHFLELNGNTTGADRARSRDADNPRRIAMHKLKAALAAGGHQESYAAAICRRQFRCGLAEASAKQLWNLVFTVRNRNTAKATAQAGVPDDIPF